MGTPHILWLWADDLESYWFSSWIEIKPPTMEIDSGSVVVSVPVATGEPLHFLNFAV